MDAAAQRAIADGNVVEAYDLVRRHGPGTPAGRREFGRVIAIASGHPVAYFNPVFALDPGANASDVLAAFAWIEELGLPVSVRVLDGLDSAIGAALEGRGLLEAAPETVMVLEPIPSAPPPPPDARIQAGGVELVGEWHRAFEADERLRAILSPGLAADRDVRIAVLDVDGDPVAGAMAFRWSSSLGLYSVGTLERARRRGFGTAVTWAAIEAGHRAWGSSIAVLQSSVMGRSVYASMGFETIGSIRAFVRQPP